MRFDLLPPTSGEKGQQQQQQQQEVAIHTCNTHDTTAYVSYPSRTVIAQSSKADISGFVCHPSTGEVEAVVVTAARDEVLPVGPSGTKLVAALARFASSLGRNGPDDSVMVASRTVKDDLWVLRCSSDTEAATYYLVTSPYCREEDDDVGIIGDKVGGGEAAASSGGRTDDGLLLLPPALKKPASQYLLVVPPPQLLLTARPALTATHYTLARSTPVDIPSRNGEGLPAYLTLPTSGGGGATAATQKTNSSSSSSSSGPQFPLALVLHGGPSARDYAGFNSLVQLLASRGIAVGKRSLNCFLCIHLSVYSIAPSSYHSECHMRLSLSSA
jgi:dipeptidyl aminopeptidase/acylaminoacyl peptidase